MDFFSENFSLLDGILSIFILINIFSGLSNGFVASLISFSKWVLAFIAVKFFLPILRPYADDYISSALVTDLILGIVIFFVTLFLSILVGKGLGKTVKWSGLGSVDKSFGILFGALKGYVVAVCFFSLMNWFYPYEKWGIATDEAYSFNIVKKGSDILIEEFPNYKEIINTKEKIEKI